MSKLNIGFFLIVLISACTTHSNNDMIGTSLLSPGNIVIQNASIIDGSGDPSFKGSVRIVAGKIEDIGDIEIQKNDLVIDAMGLTLTPGFIDTHSHMDSGMESVPDVPAALSQGITTVIVGQDGESHHSANELKQLFDKTKFSINVASYTGHGTLRDEVMGDDYKRTASAVEIEKMAALLRKEMIAGSLGLSTGLEYDPGIYSSKDEIVALAAVAHAFGGRYISHIRSEDRAVMAAIDEAINIGRATGIPVQISHIKLGRLGLWGKANTVIEKLNRARDEGIDITADIYPYTYWQSTLKVLLPERDFNDIKAAEYAVTELSSPEGLTIAVFPADKTLVGKTIAEIAALKGLSPAATYLQLIKEAYSGDFDPDERRESVIGVSMSEQDINAFIRWPHTNLCSDGASTGGHPRGYGSFPRAIRQFVREDKVLTLESMVHKMTGLSAAHVGLLGRGLIRAGYAADLVLFNAETITDHATIKDSTRRSTGVDSVWVNGELVFKSGKTTALRPGQYIGRKK